MLLLAPRTACAAFAHERTRRVRSRAPRMLAAAALAYTLSVASAHAQSSAAAEAAAPASAGEVATAPSEAAAEPWRTDRFYLETSLYTHHFHYDPAHVDKQKLILGEWNITERWLLGAAVFDNSFGQRSEALYGGWKYRPFERAQPFYLKLTAGLVHGYEDPYRNKIPFNHYGTAPAFIPSLGYCFNRICSEFVVFGGAGVLWTLGVTIP